ncbi:MAG: transketolase C-terminal domain-containing protein [Solirubrobacterales bacterium]
MTLRYVPYDELVRLRELDADPIARAEAFADACRLNTLYMIARAGSGHVGTSFSCMDVLSWLHLEVLGGDDRYFSSKGHDAPALYAVLIALGRLDFGLLHRLRRLGGLPGHPDLQATPEILTNTGSLGMGISKAKGFALADRAAGREADIYVLTGDGELQEGQFWESLGSAANLGLGRITAIVDHNKIQSDTWVAQVSDLGDLEAKVRAFGWAVARCDGNAIGEFASTLAELRAETPDRPRLIVADTRKGAGVSFMEPSDLPVEPTSLYGFHSGAPSPEDYERATEELLAGLMSRLEEIGAAPVELAGADQPPAPPPPRSPQRLIPAYAEALAALGDADPRVVGLDADLVLDCGLIPFRERHPDRFFECGIAEQDMVSQAGTMALSGLTPVVHSFACFLTTRPNEQIYNNATEGTKVVYVGSLAGLVPAGPGHSHQSVRDISAMGAMPGMSLVEPCAEFQVGQVLEWAVRQAPGSVYVRLVSVPWELGFELEPEQLIPGRGQLVRTGDDGTFVAAGPVMLSQAWGAAHLLAADGVEYGVVALPWLRDVDGEWLAELAGEGPIVALDNHYTDGGQGDAILRAIAQAGAATPVVRLGVESVPLCGENDAVLAAHGLDAASIAERIKATLPSRA